jgi:transposase-like protein
MYDSFNIMPKRKLPPNNEVIEMYDSGMSCGEIAEKCGVVYDTVYSLLKRIGHKTRNIK